MALTLRQTTHWRKWLGALFMLIIACALQGCGSPNVRPHDAQPVAKGGTKSMSKRPSFP